MGRFGYCYSRNQIIKGREDEFSLLSNYLVFDR
jgi:hypothetical protein